VLCKNVKVSVSGLPLQEEDHVSRQDSRRRSGRRVVLVSVAIAAAGALAMPPATAAPRAAGGVAAASAAAAGAATAGTASADPRGSSNRPRVVDPGAGPASITGPIPVTARPGAASRDYVFYSTPFDLRRAGYVEQEFFIAGTATRFPSNPTADQQRIAATPIGSSAYTTRIVVRRPADGRRSAGVAVVDWQNVTAGHDIDTEWGTNADYFVKHGWTWIGASVQRFGVNGATTGATANLGLKQWNPTRYASLDVTAGGTVVDDSQSFDIYTQVAQLAKGSSRNDPLSDLRLRHVYAGGASQSARFLGVYYNTVQPIEHSFDGFLIAIGGSALPPRQEVGTKAMRVYTENDAIRGITVGRVPDNASLRTWEIAGASHVPSFAVGTDVTDFRTTLGAIQTREFGASAAMNCTNPGPSQIQSWAVFHAGYDALDKWVRHGTAPRMAPQLAIPNPTVASTFLRDQNGIILGGIRLPDTEVPVALNDGINGATDVATNPLDAFCILWGTSRPLSQATLDSLYFSNSDYQGQVADVVRRLVGQKFVLAEDAPTLLRDARSRHL
jgi:Alpha/beta hydrolase domain